MTDVQLGNAIEKILTILTTIFRKKNILYHSRRELASAHSFNAFSHRPTVRVILNSRGRQCREKILTGVQVLQEAAVSDPLRK